MGSVRRLATNRVVTAYGETARSERARALISGRKGWEDLAQRVAYVTSHDVEQFTEQRLYGMFMDLLAPSWQSRPASDLDLAALDEAAAAIRTVFAQIHASFALMLTAVGIPMFLAGEEFADLHDLPHHDWRLKMSDPVDWQRAAVPGHAELRARIRELVWLRRRHGALQRNEVEFFGLAGGFHPAFDENDGPRVFAYCRSAGQRLGSAGQVIVVANCGPQDYPSFLLEWPWGAMPITESGGIGQAAPAAAGAQTNLALRPFQVRVLST